MKRLFIGMSMVLVNMAMFSNPLYHPRSLISCAGDVLEDMRRVGGEFDEECRKLAKDCSVESFIESQKRLINDYEQRSPICLIGECTSFFCCLSRSESPHLRQGLETYVTRMVDDHVQHIKGRPWQYVSFGSGGMFQDLIILTKILQKHPQRYIDIHLIDPQYNIYTDICELLGEPFSRVSNQSKPFQSILDKLIVNARSTQHYDNSSDDELRREFARLYIRVERMGQQFLNYLSSSFPQARLSLFLYKDYKDYLKQVQSRKASYPDIIVASDITDDMSLLGGSNEEYKKFVIEVLEHNPHNINVVFDKLACGILISYYSKSTQTALKTAYQLRHELAGKIKNPFRWLINSRPVLWMISNSYWSLPRGSDISRLAIPLAR